MNGMDLMRVPGLGLAPAMPHEPTTQPRVDSRLHLDPVHESTSRVKRLMQGLRPVSRERVAAACADCLPGSPAGKGPARA